MRIKQQLDRQGKRDERLEDNFNVGEELHVARKRGAIITINSKITRLNMETTGR